MGISIEEAVAADRWTDTELAHAPAGQRGEPNGQRAGLLVRAVQRDVVPRLLIAHRVAPAVIGVPIFGEPEIGRLTSLVLAEDRAAQADLLGGLRARGASIEHLYLSLLAPVARRLGVMWEQDLCGFAEVTLGVWQLQGILRDLGRIATPQRPMAQIGRVLLLPIPGEQHTFGLSMVAEFFSRAGWQVAAGLFTSAAELVAALRHDRFDCVGISSGCSDHVEDITTTVRAIRHRAAPPLPWIMVGGAIFIAHPELASAVGADATAADGREAAAKANIVLALRRGPGRGGAANDERNGLG